MREFRARRSLCGVLLVLGVLASETASAADDDPAPSTPVAAKGSPYRLKWPYDAVIVATSVASSLPAFIGQNEAPCYPRCETPRGMLPIDRASLGNYSPAAH